MSKLPIRLRLTVVFVTVMATVLVVIGLFLYYQTQSNLDDSIDQALRSREVSLQAATGAARSPADDPLPPGESLGQLLTPAGAVIIGHPAAPALLTSNEAARASRGPVIFERHERNRFAAGPARLLGRPVVAVVATSLGDRERALDGLGRALLIGGPLALLLAAVIGYATASGALAPVENIRRRADGISRADPGAQVPVPDAHDEIYRLSLTLNSMLTRMAAASAHERSFVANASHELRTPLAALRAQLDLALRHGRTAADLRTAIRAAMADSDRLAALAGGLLELAHADDSPETPHEAVDVDEVLAGVARDLRHAAQSQDRRLEARPSGYVVHGDQLAIQRAVRNMTDNALVHGRGTITLGADIAPQPRGVTLWVRDEGRLDEALRSGQAFERFVRGADAVGRPGAGLGLSLVEAVARNHGGSAVLESDPDGGVRAALFLPD